MGFATEVFAGKTYTKDIARRFEATLSPEMDIVLTGGDVAKDLYEELARSGRTRWDDIKIFFSDERAVPPEDERSNYRMLRHTLLDSVAIEHVHRIHGEDDPQRAAADYAEAIDPIVNDGGFDLVLLGMGEEGHICALFPGSDALTASGLCTAVQRPDGMQGITLTPPALLTARRIILIVTGESKAGAVKRAMKSEDPPEGIPVRVLAGHPAATFWLDEAAASQL